MKKYGEQLRMNISLLGANFTTGNLGVSALANSSIHLLKRQWPGSKISIIGGRAYSKHTIFIDGSSIEIDCYPLRYSPNIFKKNHILWVYVVIISCRLLPVMERFLYNKSTASQILKSDLTCDITGGDSFSDIYGIKRLVVDYLIKRICQISGNPFVMLPQTYGPFKSNLSKMFARKILRQADRIYSRDKESLNIIRGLIGKSEKVMLCPDVAFTLEAAPREKVEQKCDKEKSLIKKINDLKENKSQIIGFNISGLLYKGGYTGGNEFGILDNYQMLVNEIIKFFLSQENTFIMLVPHVVSDDFSEEDDLVACRMVRDLLEGNSKKRTFICETNGHQKFFDQCEIKSLIGLCDFFIGSRMHATIAAISQYIPTVALAYSKKFAGVYETVDIEDRVLDLRKHDNEKMLGLIKNLFKNKNTVKEKLEKRIPEVKKQIYSIFDDL